MSLGLNNHPVFRARSRVVGKQSCCRNAPFPVSHLFTGNALPPAPLAMNEAFLVESWASFRRKKRVDAFRLLTRTGPGTSLLAVRTLVGWRQGGGHYYYSSFRYRDMKRIVAVGMNGEGRDQQDASQREGKSRSFVVPADNGRAQLFCSSRLILFHQPDERGCWESAQFS